jgi:glutamate formiminotransferase / formiminotetrahydrofolate cyclodeaminase
MCCRSNHVEIHSTLNKKVSQLKVFASWSASTQCSAGRRILMRIAAVYSIDLVLSCPKSEEIRDIQTQSIITPSYGFEENMPNRIVECIPNFSEARRPEIVEQIQAVIQGVKGVKILDRHSDLDHNRTVITFAGTPEGVEEAAFRCIAKAAELIDLDQHTGEHPRIGATDVVPFVPISEISMEECVEIARRVGQRVGSGLEIPVYLYEQAATRPERQNLEYIRRGQYETLKDEIGTQSEREPDFGPARLSKAGAVVIGARQPLIAFNVYLTSEDVSIAKAIAKAVRHSSGGMRYVKGLGLLVEGRAQVSMNLTNFKATPVGRVVEMIRREADRYGVGIHHTELVGLIPQEALIDAAQWYMQMDQFDELQILEKRLLAADIQEDRPPTETAALPPGASAQGGESKPDFLEALAAGTAAPGGGSAAAYTGAAAAALVSMVARLTAGKKKYAQVENQMQAVLEEAEKLRAELTGAVKRDSAAFEAVMEAFRLPKDTPDEQAARSHSIEEATFQATLEPAGVARNSVRVLELAAQVIEVGNLNAISDGGAGAYLAIASLRGAGLNVRINAKSLKDSHRADHLLAELRELDQQAAGLIKKIEQVLKERGGLTLE